MPRGLYCLVMTWRPESSQMYENIDLNAAISSAMTSYKSGMRGKFKGSSGVTYGEYSFPETAPLIYPTLEVLASADGEEAQKLKNKLKKKAAFVADYYDRRAQAEYVCFFFMFS
jgi:hypothetical protein